LLDILSVNPSGTKTASKFQPEPGHFEGAKAASARLLLENITVVRGKGNAPAEKSFRRVQVSYSKPLCVGGETQPESVFDTRG
jgi:hypothetical protein